MIEHYTMTGRWREEGFSDLVFRKKKLHRAELRLLGCESSPKQMPHTIEVRVPLEFEWDDEEKAQLVVCWPLSCATDGDDMEGAQDMIQDAIATVFEIYVEEGSLFEALEELGWGEEKLFAVERAPAVGVAQLAVQETAPQPQAWTISETKGGWSVGGAA